MASKSAGDEETAENIPRLPSAPESAASTITSQLPGTDLEAARAQTMIEEMALVIAIRARVRLWLTFQMT